MPFNNYNTIAVLVQAGIPVDSDEYIQVTRQGEVIDHTGSDDAFYDSATVSNSDIEIDGEVTSQTGGVVFGKHASSVNLVSVLSTGSISVATAAIAMDVSGSYSNGVRNFGSIQSGGDGIILSGTNCSVNNGGEILSGRDAIEFDGDSPNIATHSLVFNSAAGTISGGIGILDGFDLYLQNYGQITGGAYGVSVGAASKITNGGTIDADFTGVNFTGSNTILNNSGTISTNYDIAVVGRANFSLQNSGTISSTDDDTAVSAGSGSSLENSGAIRGVNDVIALSAGNALITNSGTIAATGVAAVAAAGGGFVLRNSGRISAKTQTIELQMASTASWIVNQAGGVISAAGLDDAITDTSGIADVVNHGEIDGSVSLGSLSSLANTGNVDGQVNFTGVNETVRNSGDISYGGNDYAVHLAGGAGSYDVLLNSSTGVIQGSDGYAVYDGSGGTFNFVNLGEVSGFVTSDAVSSITNLGTMDDLVSFHAGGSLLVNRGTITGDVRFSGTGNIYRGQFGEVTGTVFGAGADGRYAGGAGDDAFDMTASGAAYVSGGAGDDSFTFTVAGLTPGTTIVGGDGLDTLAFSTAGVIAASALAHVTGIETLNLATGANTLTLNGNFVNSAYQGAIVVHGGAAHDVFYANTVSNAADTVTIYGGGGSDTITAGGAKDVFAYKTRSDSTGPFYDIINNANLAIDRFDVSAAAGGILAINTAVTTGSLSTASFNTDLAADLPAAALGAHDAVLFTASAGTLAGDTFLVVDANGAAGYQANADLVMRLTGAAGTLTTASFI